MASDVATEVIVGVIGERLGLVYSGLKPLHGDYTGYFDETHRAVYELRRTYHEDMADLTLFF